MDWKTIKCPKCPSFKKCKRKNVSKGSKNCQILLGLDKPTPEEQVSVEAKYTAFLWYLFKDTKRN